MTHADRFLRPPSQVMRLARMGSAHASRLSFLRVMLRRMKNEAWHFDRSRWNVDDRGVGFAVYRAIGPTRTYSLVAFSHDLPDEMRSDRVIATAWDATFALVDGDVDDRDIARLAQNVPLQEAGRMTDREISLSRANRSVRLFNHVIDRLASGHQPDAAELDSVGYLMRTTAVYGSGKFGAQDYDVLAQRPELSVPFQAEMLSVWLIRWFSVDIVNHLARVAGGDQASRLDTALAQRLGVGNSTGLGMAPFLVRHPQLINNWITAKERALARVRAQVSADDHAVEAFHVALDNARQNAHVWTSSHPIQVEKLRNLRDDLSKLKAHITSWPNSDYPWDHLWHWAEQECSLEGQEAIASLMIEPHGDLIDDLVDTMSADEDIAPFIDGTEPLSSLAHVIETSYKWALEIDFSDPTQNTLFWYVSEEKLEPRVGNRNIDTGSELEQPLAIGQLVANLANAIKQWDGPDSVAAFLTANPDHRLAVRRVQYVRNRPYGEVQDNLIAAETLPIDLLRCKLAFFGASRFDPRSDKWVRISLFQGLPYPLEL